MRSPGAQNADSTTPAAGGVPLSSAAGTTPVAADSPAAAPGHGTSPAGTTEQRAETSPEGGTSGKAASNTPAGLGPCTTGSWTGIHWHRRNGEPLCDNCRDYYRDYYREYERTRRQSQVYRARKAEIDRQWRERNSKQVSAYNRRRWRQQRRAEAEAARTHVDPVVVDRLLDGQRVPANRAERLTAFRRLIDRGMSPSAAGDRLGMSGSYVRKYAEAVA